MAKPKYPTYEAAAQDYLARFQALRAAPQAPAEVTRRGAGEVAAELLVDQAGAIADVSQRMLPLARAYLKSDDLAQREGISGQLLAQAAAELQVASELLHIATEDGTPPAAGAITRATRGASLANAIDVLEQAMALPIAEGLAPAIVRRAALAATPEEAKTALKQSASVAAQAIAQRVSETGGSLAFDLVFNTQWTAVAESASLLNKDLAALLAKIKIGASQVAQNAFNAAARTLANAYDKLLALLGKDLQSQARKKIQQWLDDIKNEGQIALFGKLVGKLYQVDKLEKELPGWLEQTSAGLEQINATTAEVTALSDKFSVLVGRIGLVENVIGLSKFLQASVPQLLVIATALRVLLLAVLVYSGYDYIGYAQKGKFLNITQGVAEVVRENLGIQSQIRFRPRPGATTETLVIVQHVSGDNASIGSILVNTVNTGHDRVEISPGSEITGRDVETNIRLDEWDDDSYPKGR